MSSGNNYFIKNCKLQEMERIFQYKTTNGHSVTEMKMQY